MKIPNFSEFNKDGANSRQSQRINEADDGQFFKTYEETEAWLIKMRIKPYTINSATLVVDVNNEVDLTDMRLSHIPIQFGTTQTFWCESNNLISLRGAPHKVAGSFYCGKNNLKSLEFLPVSISGILDATETKLKSLVGLSYCEVGEDIKISLNQLTDFSGSPKHINGGFYCSNNPISSMAGAPKTIGGTFDCRNCALTTLVGGPSNVGESYGVGDNKLTTLEGVAKTIGGNFLCYGNDGLTIEDLNKFKFSVGGNFVHSIERPLYNVNVGGEIINISRNR